MLIIFLFMSCFTLLCTQLTYGMDGNPRKISLSSLSKDKQEEKPKPTRPTKSHSLSPRNEERSSRSKSKHPDHHSDSSVSPRKKNSFATDERLMPPQTNQSKRSRVTFSLSPLRRRKEDEAKKLSTSDSATSPSTSPHKSPQKSVIKTSPSKASKKTILDTTYFSDDTYLIDAAREGNIDVIKNFLDNPKNDPNQQCIGSKNTLLHLAVVSRQKNEKLIHLFLENPRVFTLIKNAYNCAPYQCITGLDTQKYATLYQALLLRATLDRIVHALIMVNPQFIQQNCSHDHILQKIYQVRMRTSEIIPSYANAQFILAMIHNQIKHNLASIKVFFTDQKENPNQQDEYGNACLHHAVILRDGEMVNKLIETPEINSLVRNTESLLAHQLIPTTEKQFRELRLPLFARNSLDLLIEKQIPSLFLINPIVTKYTLTREDLSFQEIIQCIKDTYTKIENDQEEAEDRRLPQETIFPKYANDQFLLAAFHARMKEVKKIDQNPPICEQLKPTIAMQSPTQKTEVTIEIEPKKSPKSNTEILNDILIGLDSSSSAALKD